MNLSVEGRLAALSVLLMAQCGAPDGRRVLIASGDAVRLLAATNGTCPDGWGEGNFDDSRWKVARLPFPAATSACMRARFDVGTELSRYRWLHIDLTGRSQARLTSSKALGARQGLGSINWTTQDGEVAGGAAADKHYTLDLSLFPDLLQAERNVLALQVAASARPVAVSAELDVDSTPRDGVVHAVKGPYMLRPSGNAARVAWETSASAPSWLLVDEARYDGGWAVHHDVAVDGLMPDALHRVYVESAEEGSVPPQCAAVMPASFSRVLMPNDDGNWDQLVLRRNLCAQLEAALHSPPAQLRALGSDGTVRILVLGNTRVFGGTAGAIVSAAVAEQPDLIVHTGDLVREANEPDWQALFDQTQPLLAEAPIAPVPGERDLGFAIDDRFGQLFAVPGADGLGHAYSVDEGAVHVALLDSNADLAAQAVWLDADLTQAESAGARYTFVVLHYGPYSAGPEGGHADAVDAIVPVAERHHVDALLSGHDNIYEHGVVAGLHYFVTGGAGAGSDRPRPLPSTLAASSRPHYLLITVGKDGARVQAKDANASIIDDVTLQKL
jgi:hypothetical protein